jgi:hypothetical protein
MLDGAVTDVIEESIGTDLDADVAAGATTIYPTDIDVFKIEGGTAQIGDPDDGPNEPITYTVDVDADGEPIGTLTVAAPLANSYTADDSTPIILTENGNLLVERYAYFFSDSQDEEQRALIPTGMYDRLPLDTRDDSTSEWVISDYNFEGQLVLQDIDAREPVVDGTFLDNDTVLGPAIASEQIVGRHILADDLLANKIAAVLLIAAQLKTAEDGQRIEIDGTGIRWYDALDALGINFPTDGSAASISAAILASDLVVNGQASFRGSANEMIPGSALTLASVLSSPTLSPTCVINYEQLALTGGAAAQAAAQDLLCLQRWSWGSHATYQATQDTTGGSVVEEYNASDGSLNRTLVPAFGAGNVIKGVCQATVAGSRKIFILYNLAGLFWGLRRYSATTLALEAEANISTDIPNASDSASAVLGLVGWQPNGAHLTSRVRRCRVGWQVAHLQRLDSGPLGDPGSLGSHVHTREQPGPLRCSSR